MARTFAIAIVLGAILAWRMHGGLARWAAATLLCLWPALGGHFVELFFLNWLRPRLTGPRPLHTAVRIGVWFVGGTLLALGMWLTDQLFGPPHLRGSRLLAFGGVAFIIVELIAHLALHLRHRPNFYDGRG
jgi:hypothetical protein